MLAAEPTIDAHFILQAGDIEMTPTGRCIYPRSPTLALGTAAGFALLIAQVIAKVIL